MPDPLRILFAEDENSFRLALTSYLSEKGFIVEAVSSGDEAITAMWERNFDVAVLDYEMPGKSGLNVLQWMLEEKCEIPAIVLTGAGSEHIAAEAMKLGAYDYIVKNQIDMYHVPVIINGVHERHAFKKEKESLDKERQSRENIRSSLETFENAIISLSHVANNSLSLLALSFQDYIRDFVLPHLTQEVQKQSEGALEGIKKELDVVLSTIKSMLILANAMQSRLSGDTDSGTLREGIQQQVDAIMKDHRTRMDQ
jgi:DNA-binding response OmpR family regulator